MLHIILQYTKQINLSTYIYIRKTETFIGTPTQLPARGIAKPGLRTVCTRAPFFFAPDIDSQNQLSCARLSIKLHSFAPGCQTVGSRCRCMCRCRGVELSSSVFLRRVSPAPVSPGMVRRVHATAGCTAEVEVSRRASFFCAEYLELRFPCAGYLRFFAPSIYRTLLSIARNKV